MPVSRVFITRFFQLVMERRFAEAERMLERSRERARKNEWNRGYFEALSGILLAQKSNDDRYLFLPHVNPTDERELKNHRRDFQEHTRNVIHANYDRGFFSAWSDYIRVLLKLSHGKKRVKRETVRENQPVQAMSRVEIKPKTTVQTRL
ncbi:MAG: hypothetical protein JSV57_03750 [Candidatus Bathyarchaeota archaeon]|nr:MAG: hypothetical protein JSV57_03750 [Candidatus Bathyarchaeota archaeon]